MTGTFAARRGRAVRVAQRRLWCVLALLLGMPFASRGEFRPGPVLVDGAPADAPAVAHLAAAAVRAEQWPQEFGTAVSRTVRAAGGVLLVGSTDAVGPRSLNASLGLQYALTAAYRVVDEQHLAAWQVACASRGEAGAGPPGVELFPWTPPERSAAAPQELALLQPISGGRLPARTWVLVPPGSAALWVRFGSRSDQPAWEVRPHLGSWRYPNPPDAGTVTVAAAGDSGVAVTASTALEQVRVDARLQLRVVERGAWSAVLEATLPATVQEPLVWAGGVPYPVAAPGGRSRLEVLLGPLPERAVLQAVDRQGRVVQGPGVDLPSGAGEPPSTVAVLLWEEPDVDLDLIPVSPAAQARDRRAVAVVFDGGGQRRAAALAAWQARDLEFSVRCHSDLGGAGTRAWLYLVQQPGDLLEMRAWILGPRWLAAGDPLHGRWLLGPGLPDS